MNQLYNLRCNWLKETMSIDGHIDYSVLNDFENFKDLMSEEEFKTVINGKKSRSNKRCRFKAIRNDMLKFKMFHGDKYTLVFGTLTLEDKYLERQERTRTKLIDSYLKKHYEIVIINKDYGDKTEREHYHFLGLTKEKLIDSGKKSRKGFKLYNLENDDYKLGFSPDIEIVDTLDIEKLDNYTLKLNNHSNKKTTKQRIRVIKNTTYELWELQNPSKRVINNQKKRVIERQKRNIITYTGEEILGLF